MPNRETDFVAKNDDFGAFANSLVDLAMQSDSNTLEDLLNQKYANSELTVKEKITEQSGVIGEKIEISAFGR